MPRSSSAAGPWAVSQIEVDGVTLTAQDLEGLVSP
jgi:hypothetical protein